LKAKVKILIVEDDDDVRLNLKNVFLSENSYEIFVASNGLGAITILTENDIDLIISDYKMDVLGGNLWLKFLQKFCFNIKIIFITGFLEHIENFPFPILYKPFNREDIIKMVKNILA